MVVLALLLLLPVGVDANLENASGNIRAKVGPVNFEVFSFPGEKGAKARRREKKKKSGNIGETAGEEKKKVEKRPDPDYILALIKMGLHALGRFRRKLSVDLLEARLVCGGSDPYSTAMSYGYISAAVGTLIPLIERAIKLRRHDIDVDIDFDSSAVRYSARLIATIQIWEIFHIGFAFLFEFLSYRIKQRKAKAATERNDISGKPDQRSDECDDVESEEHGGCKHNCRRTDNLA